MEIKYKIVGNTIILIIDGKIVTRTLHNDELSIIDSIKDLIREYNNEVSDNDDKLRFKGQIISLMLPPKVTSFIDKTEIKDFNELAKIESYENAFKGDEITLKRITDISETFEYDINGHVYLEGFTIPIPKQLAEALLDANYNPESKYTVQSLVNFWKWALLNPNQKARVDLFKWFDTGKFVITEKGFVVAYRNVNIKKKGIDSQLETFVNQEFIKVKKQKHSPRNYAVLKIDNQYQRKFLKNNENLVNDVNYIGVLSDLYSDVNTNESSTVYTDAHTHTFNIIIGEEVSMPRNECDENHEQSCSRGLHFMSPAYGLRLGSTTLVILINPYNIVAFPSYDNTKGRTCAYLPLGLAEKDEEGIVELNSGTYDFDYSNYDSVTLDSIIKGKSLSELKEQNLIASDITEIDFNLIKDDIMKTINSRIITIKN